MLLGSSRNSDDDKLVSSLKTLVCDCGIERNVDFVVNAPYSALQAHLSEAGIGLHTMWNEHFGISVVEMMAAGLVVIAHRSGGPLMDIVVNCAGKPTGTRYVNCICEWTYFYYSIFITSDRQT